MALQSRSEGAYAFVALKDDETIKGLVKEHKDIVLARTIMNRYQKVAIEIEFKDGYRTSFDWDFNARLQRAGRTIPADILRVKTNTLTGYSCITDRAQ